MSSQAFGPVRGGYHDQAGDGARRVDYSLRAGVETPQGKDITSPCQATELLKDLFSAEAWRDSAKGQLH